MKFNAKVLVIALIMLLTITGGASAALIGVDLELPLILSDSPGYYSYNAGTNLFTSWGNSVWITFDGVNRINLSPRGLYNVAFYVDELGRFAGGVAGDDLRITGTFSYGGTNYSGLLLAGEVNNFGWAIAPDRNGDGSLDLHFDFTFDFTGGMLAPFYAAYDNRGADFSDNRINNFTGDWNVSHAGERVKIETAPTRVPEPGTLLLFGSGLAGIAVYLRNRKKI